MPIYEYLCMTCSEKFSLLQRISAAEDESECPVCGSKDVKKIMSAFCCSSGSSTGFTPPGRSGGFGGGG